MSTDVNISIHRYARGVGIECSGTDVEAVCSAYELAFDLVGDKPGFGDPEKGAGTQVGSGSVRERIRVRKASENRNK